MPASVFVIGCLVGTETFRLTTAANLAALIAAVSVASYREVPSPPCVRDPSYPRLWQIAVRFGNFPPTSCTVT